MTLEDKVSASLDRIGRWLDHWQAPVVLWSGGKDSTALLHLVRQVRRDIPVVQYREPKMRERYAFSDRLIRDWDLEVYDYPPSRIALASGPDIETGRMRFDLLKYQQWGESAVVLSLGTDEPEEGRPFLCGIKDVLARPTGSFNWPWDFCLIGSKSADVDLIKGQVPLAQDIRKVPGGPWTGYALRDWTDADVFSYLEAQAEDLLDGTRYVKTAEGWRNNPDKRLNADFYPVCFNCVNRHLGPVVYCPKLRGEMTNVSDRAPYEDLVFPELGFQPTWNADGTLAHRE
jgi:hypothetical protein